MKTLPYRRLAGLAVTALALLLLAACGGTPEGGQAALGASLYAANCQACHGLAATGEGRTETAPTHGPDGHTWHHADGQLADIVLGRLTYPGRTMPPFEGMLNASEVEAILAYLKTGWTPEQRGWQAEVSRNWEELQSRR